MTESAPIPAVHSTAPPSASGLIEMDQTPVVATVGTAPGLIALAGASYLAARLQRPHWPRLMRWLLATVWFGFYQIADTLHTVGHIRSARQVNAPMDRVLLTWGLQGTHYDDNNVTPRQHMGRAAGGVGVSGVATLLSYPFYAVFGHLPVVGALIEAWFVCNALLFLGAAAPTPHNDGATLLKWVVAQRTGEEALGDEAVQTAGSALIGGLGLLTLVLLLRGRWRSALGALLAGGAAALDLFVLKGKLPM